MTDLYLASFLYPLSSNPYSLILRSSSGRLRQVKHPMRETTNVQGRADRIRYRRTVVNPEVLDAQFALLQLLIGVTAIHYQVDRV